MCEFPLSIEDHEGGEDTHAKAPGTSLHGIEVVGGPLSLWDLLLSQELAQAWARHLFIDVDQKISYILLAVEAEGPVGRV